MEDKEKSLAGKIIENANPVDFARGLYDGAIARPLLSIVQLSESNGARTGKSGKPVPASGPDSAQDKTIAHQAGVMAGQIVDFSVLALASHGALKPVLKESLNGTAGTAAKMFAAGAVDGGLLTASKADQNERHGLLGARLENALVSGSTFAVMGAVGKSLEGVKLLEQEALISKGLKSALAGASGGVVSAYGNALGENRLASGSEVLSAAGQYALFSLGFQALGAGIGKAAAHPKVESLYYRAKWEMHDGAVEARRLGYATLNTFNLRHPLQRLGDALTTPKQLPRPTLSAENHPVLAFEKHYEQFVKDIRALDTKYESTPRGDRREIFDEINEAKANFGRQLLEIWHGTADRPGLAVYSDSELAQVFKGDGLPSLERIASIRQALQLSMKRESYHSPSPFEEAMLRLGKGDTEALLADVRDPFELTVSLDKMRERYFDYDERALANKLSLGQPYHSIARGYGTPVGWMPFEASEKLANLFHCTVSRSLDLIFSERAMLPSSEIRLRGIKQATGESAGHEFPRKAISMTRDFGEAFCYSRHSPPQLTDYPVVFGISRDVASRAYSAGMLEPGEILINKLRLGSTFLQKLGLSKPEITHIYVPDAKVPEVTLNLANRRIRGVRVVGFNDIDTPRWIPQPPRQW